MTRLSISGICLALKLNPPVLTGPTHVSAGKFEQSYIRNQTVMMEQYFYAGETNGRVYISHMRLPRTYYSKQKGRTSLHRDQRLGSRLFGARSSEAKPDEPRTYWSGKQTAEPKD